MKNLLIILFSVLALVSCKTKKKVAETNVKTEFSYTANDMVASIERTMCFGVCPAYKMEIYGDGKIIYEGIKNVDHIGKFEGKTTTEKIDKLLAKAKEIEYMDLNDSYENKSVTDLPSTTTVILLNEVSKKVYSRYNAPEKLVAFHKFFEELFKDEVLTEQK